MRNDLLYPHPQICVSSSFHPSDVSADDVTQVGWFSFCSVFVAPWSARSMVESTQPMRAMACMEACRRLCRLHVLSQQACKGPTTPHSANSEDPSKNDSSWSPQKDFSASSSIDKTPSRISIGIQSFPDTPSKPRFVSNLLGLAKSKSRTRPCYPLVASPSPTYHPIPISDSRSGEGLTGSTNCPRTIPRGVRPGQLPQIQPAPVKACSRLDPNRRP